MSTPTTPTLDAAVASVSRYPRGRFIAMSVARLRNIADEVDALKAHAAQLEGATR